jgi:hypothetical protein
MQGQLAKLVKKGRAPGRSPIWGGSRRFDRVLRGHENRKFVSVSSAGSTFQSSTASGSAALA